MGTILLIGGLETSLFRMYKPLSICILAAAFILFEEGYAWDKNYININWKQAEKRYGGPDQFPTFRLFSTKPTEGDVEYRDIEFDKDTDTATLKDEDRPFFDNTLETKIIVHGNGGNLVLDSFLWRNYSQVAEWSDVHYNIIGIRWGSGPTLKHAYVGVKLAKVVKSFVEKYGLIVSSIHGIGFSYGTHIVSAMATEIKESGLGQVDRLTLLDPGTKVSDFKVDGKTQQGLIHKDDASFVDVFHTSSKYGIWEESLGDVDVWPNGGKDQAEGIYPDGNGHRAAVYFFARTIVEPEGCQYLAWKCADTFTSYEWKNRGQNDNCGYGDETKETEVVGEYVNHKAEGNYVFFTTIEYEYCEKMDCETTC